MLHIAVVIHKVANTNCTEDGFISSIL